MASKGSQQSTAEVASGAGDRSAADVPWPQQLLESPWLLAGAALLFFTLSYVVWGLIDLLTVTPG